MPIRARGTRLTYRSLVVAAVAALMAVLLLPAGAQGASPRKSGPVASGPPESSPVHSYENAVRESVWVDTGLDGDKNGRSDRVAVDIVRPREPARQGRKIPVIMDAGPCYSCCGRGNESQLKTYDADGRPVRFPLYYDNYFVPRGYAFVAVDLAGTNRSDGCVDVGGRSDAQSAKAVIDWLNGRARGYTTRTGGERATADWSDGRTGMIGKSYDGTIDLAATDHVVPAGHRLALIVAGTDRDLIDPPDSTPTLTLDLARTSAKLPFTGGTGAFVRAGAGSAPATATSRAVHSEGVTPPRPAHRIPGGSRS
ncbi:CocE/NonD family hydrolase [Streptomyces sp. NBC_01618]|uniref:CocE/NonD family hydrolase n=1 Tax=Streptomyces sp. NBC_01618 TaxID=2975900 RepID=UPI00386F54C1|nr:hypothetical protein OH735_33125 [Streptomyces sp. NBC_01618]